jgi:hypothetical protein
MGFLNNVGKWFEDREQDVENTFKWGVGQGVSVIKNTEDSVSDIITLPLILIGAGVMFFLWNSNLGQTAELQKSAPLLMG